MRRLLLTVSEVDSRLSFVVNSDEIHAVGRLGQIEAAAATVQGTIAAFDREAALAAIAAALRPATRQQIGEMAAAVVGCFPSADKRELSVFGAALPREIGDREPSAGALDLGFKAILAHAHFLPSVAEAVAAIEAAQARLTAAAEQIPNWEERRARMQARLEHVRRRARWHAAQLEKRKASSS